MLIMCSYSAVCQCYTKYYNVFCGVCVGFLLYAAERRLEELQSEIGDAEQQVLKVTEELQQLEDALGQKKVSFSTKSKGRCLKQC